MSIVYLAACGETLNIDFTLPFHEFVPATCNTRFCLRVSVHPHKHLHALVCCAEYVTKHYNLTLKHQRSSKSTLNDTELSYRLRTQTCACVCLTVTPAGTRCSRLLRITSIASPLQKTICQQKGKEHLPKTTNLAGGTWLTLSKSTIALFVSLLFSISSCLRCPLTLLLCVCVCVFVSRAGWVDCWSVPNFMLIIDYTWHPIYPQKSDQQLKQSCKCLNNTNISCKNLLYRCHKS